MSGPYGVIYADPPWRYDDKALAGKRGAECKYRVLSHDDIAGLPVAEIAAADCALFLWATCPQLPVATSVMDAWGFQYKTVAFAWVKTTIRGDDVLHGREPTTKGGLVQWGMGSWTRANVELCLLGVRGKPRRVCKAVHQVVFERPGKHSAKPPIVRDRITQLMGYVPRIELFARERDIGWDAHGDELSNADVTWRV